MLSLGIDTSDYLDTHKDHFITAMKGILGAQNTHSDFCEDIQKYIEKYMCENQDNLDIVVLYHNIYVKINNGDFADKEISEQLEKVAHIYIRNISQYYKYTNFLTPKEDTGKEETIGQEGIGKKTIYKVRQAIDKIFSGGKK